MWRGSDERDDSVRVLSAGEVMDESDECDCDEGSIWIPHAERMVLQEQMNAIMRQLLDNAALVSLPR